MVPEPVARQEHDDARVTISAFARLRGVTPAAVRKAIRDGRISGPGDDGLMDAVVAMEQWSANSRAYTVGVMPKRSAGRRKAPRAAGAANGNGGGPAPPAPAGRAMTFQQARTMRERYAALTARVAYRKAVGELVDAEHVRASAFEVGQRVRDRMLAIADRLAPVVAGSDDIAACHRMITAELKQVLDELAEGATDG